MTRQSERPYRRYSILTMYEDPALAEQRNWRGPPDLDATLATFYTRRRWLFYRRPVEYRAGGGGQVQE